MPSSSASCPGRSRTLLSAAAWLQVAARVRISTGLHWLRLNGSGSRAGAGTAGQSVAQTAGERTIRASHASARHSCVGGFGEDRSGPGAGPVATRTPAPDDLQRDLAAATLAWKRRMSRSPAVWPTDVLQFLRRRDPGPVQRSRASQADPDPCGNWQPGGRAQDVRDRPGQARRRAGIAPGPRWPPRSQDRARAAEPEATKLYAVDPLVARAAAAGTCPRSPPAHRAEGPPVIAPVRRPSHPRADHGRARRHARRGKDDAGRALGAFRGQTVSDGQLYVNMRGFDPNASHSPPLSTTRS